MRGGDPISIAEGGASALVANRATAVVKSDTTELTGVRALYVGGSGDLSVLMVDDAAPVTFTAVPAGTVLPVAAKKVMAATTATAIVALY